MGAIVGRRAELAAIDHLLDGVDGGPGLLTLTGAAGIGKTILWEGGVAAARQRCFVTLCARPAETEARLRCAGLADLLTGIEEEDLSALPAVQRRALDIALLRAAPDDAVPDPRAIGAALLSVLNRLAARGPVLVAVDDVQWLDVPTLTALQFATRRCTGPIAMLVAERVGDRGPVVDVGPADESCRRRVHVGRLSLAALHDVIEQAIGATLSRHAMLRVAEISGGNPFYAIELARTLDAAESDVARLPGSLHQVVQVRLARLPAATVEALNVLSALAEPTVSIVAAALGAERDTTANLGPAEDAGVIKIDAGRVGFTHPLLAHAVYSSMGAAIRRDVHRRLSEVVDDVEERAHHLAAAAIGPDADAARALVEAAHHARRRGAPSIAARHVERAIELGTDDPTLRVDAGEDHCRAGNLARASQLLESAVDSLESGVTRARALVWLSVALFQTDASADAVRHLEQAVREAADDPSLLVLASTQAAWMFAHSGHVHRSARYAEMAVEAARQVGDGGVRADALACNTITRYLIGEGLDESSLERALRLEEDLDRSTSVQNSPSHIAGLIFRWTQRLDRAQAAFARARQRCLERGADGDLWLVDLWSVPAHCAAGDVADAEALVAEQVARSRVLAQTGQTRAITATMQAGLAAWVGRIDDARAAVSRAMQQSASGVAPVWALALAEIQGMVELSAGDAEAAADVLVPAVQLARGGGLAEPAAVPGLADAIEALLLSARHDEAGPLIEWVDASGGKPGHWWARAVGCRYRALLLDARDDVGGAHELLEQALAAHDHIPEARYDRARTLLLAGRWALGRRQRRQARGYLDESTRLFDQVGARRWAASARAALGRCGPDPGLAEDLTAREQHIAELVAEGHTNREIAATLFVSAKTVEAHLSRVYRKLGIRNRAELSQQLTDRR